MGSNGESGRSRGRNGKSKALKPPAQLSRRTERGVRRAARAAESAAHEVERAARGSGEGPGAPAAARANLQGVRIMVTTASGERIEVEAAPVKATWYAHIPTHSILDLPPEEATYMKQALAEQYIESTDGLLSVSVSNWPEIVSFTIELSWNGWLLDVAEPEIETISSDTGTVRQELIYRMERA